MTDIRASLTEFGADPSALRLLDDECPELLPYATLMTARRNGHGNLDAVKAVYEWQDAPLVFLIDADSLEDDDQLQQIRRLLAMRGDAPYLGLVAPGSLRVYRIALDRKSLRQARVGWEDGEGAKNTVFLRLGNDRPHAAITDSGWISNIVLRLLSRSRCCSGGRRPIWESWRGSALRGIRHCTTSGRRISGLENAAACGGAGTATSSFEQPAGCVGEGVTACRA